MVIRNRERHQIYFKFVSSVRTEQQFDWTLLQQELQSEAMNRKLIIHDISMTLEEGMLTYPKDVPYQRRLQRSISRGDTSNVSEFTTTAHIGTHVDAPRHYLNDGYGVDQIPLESLFGPAYVLDCRGQKAITAAFLADKLPINKKVERLLLKTD
ncbi:MAG: cyclase family protein, partial [Sedimentisphaerales bacterium]|nr:cyclase family protein [Sedimentisphaerales bacterium]